MSRTGFFFRFYALFSGSNNVYIPAIDSMDYSVHRIMKSIMTNGNLKNWLSGESLVE